MLLNFIVLSDYRLIITFVGCPAGILHEHTLRLLYFLVGNRQQTLCLGSERNRHGGIYTEVLHFYVGAVSGDKVLVVPAEQVVVANAFEGKLPAAFVLDILESERQGLKTGARTHSVEVGLPVGRTEFGAHKKHVGEAQYEEVLETVVLIVERHKVGIHLPVERCYAGAEIGLLCGVIGLGAYGCVLFVEQMSVVYLRLASVVICEQAFGGVVDIEYRTCTTRVSTGHVSYISGVTVPMPQPEPKG